MKAQPIIETADGSWECVPSEATHVFICLPAVGNLLLPVVVGNKSRQGTPCWSWNGDTEKPTLKPSILNKEFHNGGKTGRSHCFVNDGEVKFLNDCTHEFAGKTVPLEDVDADFFR